MRQVVESKQPGGYNLFRHLSKFGVNNTHSDMTPAEVPGKQIPD